MMFPQIIDGKVWVPMRAEGPDGLIGDGMVEMSPDDPEYEKLKAEIEANDLTKEQTN
jgi:hypothetical protein